jgi:GT2 family glycosyltransferase
MLYPWNKIPDDIRADLLFSSTGWRNLLDMAVRVFASAEKSLENRAFLLDLGSGLLRSAWEEQPLQPNLCQQLAFVDKAFAFLDPSARGILETIRTSTQSPESADAAPEGADHAKRLAGIPRDMIRDNLYWLNAGMEAALGCGRFAWIERNVGDHPLLPEAAKAGLLADCAFLQGNFSAAAALYAQACAVLPQGVWRERHGHALHKTGRTEQALNIWEAELEKRPWHWQLWLVRDNVLRGLDRPGAFPQGPGVILLYTWNGGDKIDRTLGALSEARFPDDARILVLNNGSDDGQTPGILAKWEQHFQERLRGLRLPCNIGAPAARNWLLTEQETRASEWLAFLDDDLLVPPDWLGHFGTIMRAMPDHGVYGCAVLRHDSPWLFQGVDIHLRPPSRSVKKGNFGDAEHLQSVSRAEDEADFGQYGYSRPCVHVCGCCHIFRRERLDQAGMFDVRFSPSQVDDFEHDVRMFSGGDAPCCHGSLKVRHMYTYTSGMAAEKNLPKAVNAYANHLKMQSLYPRPQFDVLYTRNQEMLLRDIIRRQR